MTLGNYYRQLEQTIEKDILSHYYYNIAVELGYAPAKFMVALDYMGGDGVNADMTLAVKYMPEAADEGVAKAQYMYALFCSGDDNKSNGKAISYFERAAKQGLARAQVALGDIYVFERKEIGNAIFWWVCAYMHGGFHPYGWARCFKGRRQTLDGKLLPFPMGCHSMIT